MANPNSISWNSESEDDDDNLFEEGKGPEEEQWFLPPAEESRGIFTTEGGNDLFDQIMGDAEQEDSAEGTEEEESTEGGIFSRLGESDSGVANENEEDADGAEDTEPPIGIGESQDAPVEESSETAQTEGVPEEELVETEVPVTDESEGELHHEDEVSLNPPAENLAEEVENDEPSQELEQEEEIAPTEAIDETPSPEVTESEDPSELEEQTPALAQEEEVQAEETAVEAEDELLASSAEEARENEEVVEADNEVGAENATVAEESVENTENELANSEQEDIEQNQAPITEDLSGDRQEIAELAEEEIGEALTQDDESVVSESEGADAVPEEAIEDSQPEYEEVEIPLDEVAPETDPPAEELAELAESEILDNEEESAEPPEAEDSEEREGNEIEEEPQPPAEVEEDAEAPLEESSEPAEEESEEESERQRILKQIRQRVDAEFQNEASRREATLQDLEKEKGTEKSIEDYMIDLDTLNMGLLVHYLSKRRDRKLGERIDDTNKDLEELRKETEDTSSGEAVLSQTPEEHEDSHPDQLNKQEELPVPENIENPLENSHFITSQPENISDSTATETATSEATISEEAAAEAGPVYGTEKEVYVTEELSPLQQNAEFNPISSDETSAESESSPDSGEYNEGDYTAQNEAGNETPEEESFEQRQEKKGLDSNASSMATANQSSVYTQNPSATPISDIITARQSHDGGLQSHHEVITEHASHKVENEDKKVSKYSSSIKAGFAAGLSVVGLLILYLIIK